MAYLTVAGEGESEEVIGGSRFLAVAREVASSEDARALLRELEQRHPDATHHCWAYRIAGEMRFSDGGEPAGTAGRPILEVVLKRDIDRVGVVVVRYFGGRKLGAGGLVRAYGGTASKALDSAGEKRVDDMVRLGAHVPYESIDSVRRLLGEVRGSRIEAEEYDSRGWSIELVVPLASAEEVSRRVRDLTRGVVDPRRVERL